MSTSTKLVDKLGVEKFCAWEYKIACKYVEPAHNISS
jgi:hypothetical protein